MRSTECGLRLGFCLSAAASKLKTDGRRCGVTEGMIHSYSEKNSHCIRLFSRKMQYFRGVGACVQIVHTYGNKL
jgi:hypothetical protein